MEFNLILKFALGILGSLLGNLLFGSGAPEQVPHKKFQEQVKHPIAVEHHKTRNELKVPSFVTHVPKGHFAGVSPPMQSLAEARRAAVADVVRQVLGAIGVQYDHRYVQTVSGSVRGPGLKLKVHDRLSSVAHGIVLGVERNMVESSWAKDPSGKWIYFVLVRYPGKLIAEMRRLSKGAKVVASFIFQKGGDAWLKIMEVNGVSVTLSTADVTVRKRNRFAKVITLFLWRVPQVQEDNFSVALGPITLCGDTAQVRLPTAQHQKGIEDYLLGAKLERSAVLKGQDEIGRSVALRVCF